MLLHQGSIIKVEYIKNPVLIVSKDYFNETGEIIGCPIFAESSDTFMHIYISNEDISGYVQCEKLTLLDLNMRGHSVISAIDTLTLMEISDIIQGIFDYI